MGKSFYDVLGVRPDAEDVAIKAVYRALMLRYHPDTNQDPSAVARAKQINKAYETLSDPVRRSKYDAELRLSEHSGWEGTPPPQPPPQPAPPSSPQAAEKPPKASDPKPVQRGRLFAGIAGLLAIVVIVGLANAGRSPIQPVVQSAPPTIAPAQASSTPGKATTIQPSQSSEATFRAYLDQVLGNAARQYGTKDSLAEYKILYTGDLNQDGLDDFIIYNSTVGFCGSGGCSAEVYLGKLNGGFSELDAPDLFGAGLVLVSGHHGQWKDIVKVETGEGGSFSNYTRLVFDPKKSMYVAVRSEFCGGLDFNVCDSPVVLCEIDGSGLEVVSGASVYMAPVDKVSSIAGSLGERALRPAPSPDEFGWISAATPDGEWLLVHYKFSGARFVRAADVAGSIPRPPARCG